MTSIQSQDSTLISEDAARALARGQYVDAFSLLGMHTDNNQLVVRCFLPGALAVDVLSAKDGKKVASLSAEAREGMFAGVMGRRVKPFPYLLRVAYPSHVEDVYDPYGFESLLSDYDLYLFGEGRQLYAQDFLGANPKEVEGVAGVLFGVWAPNAARVSVVGDFNHWDGRIHVMRFHPANGVWDIFIPGVHDYAHYKFEILTADGELLIKSDPFAKTMEAAPNNASRVAPRSSFVWQDQDWMQARDKDWHRQAISIYELHLGSWRRKGESGDTWLTYRELADELVPYVKSLGFTHIELMPLSEFPFDGSWGYQPVGLFAPTQRFGSSDDLKYLIDTCHRAGIGVLMDWVIAHFPADAHGLARFDGTCLFEHQDPRRGRHPDWDTLIFNYGRAEVQSFLLSAATVWLRDFHIDGLRLDAVSSMLYLDYSRAEGEWLPNADGGRENHEAIECIKLINSRLYGEFPGIVMIAEESTAWDGVCRPVSEGGLGFGFKWNMGWMNDTLAYLGKDPVHRRWHHHQLTFGIMYAHSEQFILSLSHDEVVHGKASLLSKIPGDDWQKFATLRAYYGYMWGFPGKKLLFMGAEFGQRAEWNHDQSLDWHLLQYAPHQGLSLWLSDLNRLYQSHTVLGQTDHDLSRFCWLDCDNAEQGIYAFVRGEGDEALVFVVNMTPQPLSGYRLGLPCEGDWRELLNSDASCYGGCNQGNGGVIVCTPEPAGGQPQSALITIPPLGCLVLGLSRDKLPATSSAPSADNALPVKKAPASTKAKSATKAKPATKAKSTAKTQSSATDKTPATSRASTKSGARSVSKAPSKAAAKTKAEDPGL
ncbi:1,4-alpha-glucan branching protein GlgB [Shewanella litorisediminis]|uniref:1,4-alpha-glucan branching enzyme GlgB n=1 Tax=Shewanella litorisediminis TaxID=1173586 RepID=A0ABX7G0D1_9GAMM|nr:1,4-alpha-glucan branching protein GlgB [Shewanella litorisediminis]MCL2918208.1 1,4-alpha-glucan branching protein GlgB [Shewanella litorisediminis]QRH00739.1 1,4-alpha-glucan branching protein GlgB [Shewanella litorisediminis]